MGQKVNPTGLRIGINRTWDSRWYAGKKDFAEKLQQDVAIRKFAKAKLKEAGVARIIIERTGKKVVVTIHSAKPGVVIGKKGSDIEKIKKDLQKFVNKDIEVVLNIVEIRKPEVDAKLVAEGIAQQIEKRIAFRRAMKRAMSSAMRLGAKGIRVNCSGRLGGTEIARMEWYREGRVPLHTLRADVQYATAEAFTTYGLIGIKVWIYKGDIMEHDPMAQEKRANAA
jgi:small subunit ribosomal protein S3